MADTTHIQDFRLKAEIYDRLFVSLKSSLQGADRASGPKVFASVLQQAGEIRISPSQSDGFTDAIVAYHDELLPIATAFENAYRAFRKFAEEQKQAARARPKVDSIDKIIRSLQNVLEREDRKTNEVRVDNDNRQNTYGYFVFGELKYLSRKLGELAAADRTRDAKSGTGWGDFERAVSSASSKMESDIRSHNYLPVSNYIDSVISTDLPNELSSLREVVQSGHYFDGSKSSVDDFIAFNESPPDWEMPDAARLTPDQNPFTSLMTPQTFYNRIGIPFAKAAYETSMEVRQISKLMSKEQQATTLGKDLLTLETSLKKLLTALPTSALKGTRLDEVKSISEFLTSRPDLLLSTQDSMSSQAQKRPNGKEESAGSTTAGFMYRRLDMGRLDAYVEQYKNFSSTVSQDAVDGHVSNLSISLANRLKEIDASLSGADKVDEGAVKALKRTLRVTKVTAYTGFVDSVRGSVNRFVNMQVDFVCRRHQEGAEYIRYWRDAMANGDAVTPEVNESFDRAMEEYGTARGFILDRVNDTLGKAIPSTIRTAFQAPPPMRGGDSSQMTSSSVVVLDEPQESTVNAMFTDILLWVDEKMNKLIDLHTVGRPSVFDRIMDSHSVLLYALKVSRLAVSWYALRVAGKLFQDRYDHMVYSMERDPPSPFVFVAMFLAVDVAVNATLMVILVLIKRMFKTLDNDFPLDGLLLSAWLLDYISVTAVVAAMSLIIAQIIRRKKYFRYKYEGDRGIRAMKQMVFQVYCVVLCIPFFRLANG